MDREGEIMEMKFSCIRSLAWRIAPSLERALGFIIARSCSMMNVNG